MARTGMLTEDDVFGAYEELREINSGNRLLGYLVYSGGKIVINPDSKEEFDQRFRDPFLGRKETPLAVKLERYHDALQRAISSELHNSRINA